jgi:hypothetical protein
MASQHKNLVIIKSPHTAMVQGLSHTAIPTSFSQYGVNEAIQHSLLYEVTRTHATENPPRQPKTQGISLSQLLYERRSVNERKNQISHTTIIL